MRMHGALVFCSAYFCIFCKFSIRKASLKFYIRIADINWDCPRQMVQTWLQGPRDVGDRPVKHPKKCPV